MKYIPLSSLQNPYPTISKYRNEVNSVSIDGFYPENSLNIPVTDFTQLGIISGTLFRFIVKTDDGNLYTSDSFYNDLVRAKQSKNPYFINTVLNPKTFIEISLSQLRQTFEKRIIEESKWNVTCIFNNLFEGDGSLNIQRFGEYIDWVVSKPQLNDIIDNGVLNSSIISRFDIEEFNIENIGETTNTNGNDTDINDEDTSNSNQNNENNNSSGGSGNTSESNRGGSSNNSDDTVLKNDGVGVQEYETRNPSFINESSNTTQLR
jgi:hypothetical protein